MQCPPKVQHFLWQLLSGCIAVIKNLKTRGIQGDICCARCGDPEESINHVFSECMKNLRQFQVTFAKDCFQLVKLVLEREEWPAFDSYLEDIKLLKRIFINSEIVHVPRTENLRTDSLAHSVRKQSSFVVHTDAELPAWFTESVWICECLMSKKKKWRKTSLETSLGKLFEKVVSSLIEYNAKGKFKPQTWKQKWKWEWRKES